MCLRFWQSGLVPDGPASGSTWPVTCAGSPGDRLLEAGQSPLTQRYNLELEEGFTSESHGQKSVAAYYAHSLDLCLQLRGILTVSDIKKSAAAALLDKLTRLWEILLPLGIDLGAMKDFQ